MLKNNLKIAFRQLLKSKFITGVNLLGLVLGVTAAFFIWQYVTYEKSYDDFHENVSQIYRVRTDRVENGVPFMQFAGGAAFAGPFMKEHFSEVEDYVKLATSSVGVFATEQGDFVQEEKVYYTTPNIFDIFSFELIKGNPKTSLEKPFTACLSESMARKLYGEEDPIGKTITRNGRDRYEITGVFADCPGNSHLKFHVLLSYTTYADVFNEGGETETSPYWDGFFTYLLLQPNADYLALEEKISPAIGQFYDEEAQASVELYLQPLADIHLTSNYLIEAETNGDGNAVRFLSIIGIIVLFIAWLNYINLAVARSILRSKEVGIRKVVGSSRGRLMSQFLTETALINGLALLVGLGLVKILHPSFESLVGKAIPIDLFTQAGFWYVCGGILIVGTLLSGLYPALLVSGFQPIEALRTSLTRGGAKGGWLQKGLVVIQFTASVALIASTIIIYNQLKHMNDTELGLNVDQTLILKGPNAVTDSVFLDKALVLKDQVEQLAMVEDFTSSTSIPGQAFGWTAGGVRRVGDESDDSESFHVMAAESNYSTFYGMELVAGRHMTASMGTDQSACLLNETGAALLNFKTAEEAIGKQIEFWGDQFTVVGVLEDFHQESPKAEINPLILRDLPSEWVPDYYSIKINPQQLSQTLAGVQTAWASAFPGNPLDFFFLDEHFNLQYEADQRFGRIFTLFSILAIVVSCLGLFALVAFIAERKKKEIGIRKVLGASVASIVTLLSKDFMKLVLLALVVATPLAWYFMDGWLDNFAIRTNIHWSVFALAGVAAIVVALLTMSIQSIKAAIANPINALRSE